MMSSLVVLSPLGAGRTPQGELVLPKKFLTGLQAYAAEWPGRVISLVRPSRPTDDNLDPVVFRRSEWDFDVSSPPDELAGLDQALRGAAVALLGDTRESLAAAEACRARKVSVVHVLEWNHRTRRQILWHDAPGLLRKVKRVLWGERHAARLRRAVLAATGLQCNGTPSFEDFGPLNPRSLLFFDSRVSRHMIVAEEELNRRLDGLPKRDRLRLVFSGRMVGIKGVLDLPDVICELSRAGVPVQLDLFGGGHLEVQVREKARALGILDSLRMHGVVDFESELIPWVRREADLFVCCHIQGDPSCTYLETFGCGVPIAGFANDALRGLIERAPCGWTARPGRPADLARRIAEAWKDRAALAAASRAARAFALEHSFEDTMRRRVDHLRQCALGGSA